MSFVDTTSFQVASPSAHGFAELMAAGFSDADDMETVFTARRVGAVDAQPATKLFAALRQTQKVVTAKRRARLFN